MRVLVTGGLGFVGYAVTHVLADAGHQVTVLARDIANPPPLPEGTQLVSADLRHFGQVKQALARHEFDGVCHLAGLARVRDSFDNPLEYFHTNVNGTINLLRALTDQNTKPVVVFASTGAVYGSTATGVLDENTPVQPDTPYAASKRAAEQLLTFHARTGAIGSCALRCFSISGAYNDITDRDDTRIITKALLVAVGRAPSVTVNGDGTATRDFTHVLDIAHAYQLAIEATKPGDERIYNVGTGTGVSVRDIIETVTNLTGRSVVIEHRPPRNEPHALVSDSRRARHDLGWSPSRSELSAIVRDAWATGQ